MSSGAGTSESASAGCSLSERLRPSTSKNRNNSANWRDTTAHNNNGNRSDVDNGDLIVYTWGRGNDSVSSLINCSVRFDVQLVLLFYSFLKFYKTVGIINSFQII